MGHTTSMQAKAGGSWQAPGHIRCQSPPCSCREDPLLKHLPLVALCNSFPGKSSAFLPFSLLLELPVCPLLFTQLDKHQRISKILGKGRSILCLQTCWHCQQPHHPTQEIKKIIHFLNQPTNESMLSL